MTKIFLFTIFLLSSCTYFIELIEDDGYKIITPNKDKLSIVFTHNVNGETHPCGCRHFPLGGLPQVAGKLHDLKKNSDVVFIDSGDMIFASSNIPGTLDRSLTFNAKNLFKGMSDIGLNYFTPGDQDLAKGTDFLNKLLKESKTKLLISNLKDPKTLPSQEVALIEKAPHKIYLIGLVFPSTLFDHSSLFYEPESRINEMRTMLKKYGYDSKNKFHRLILVSHGGMDNDKKLAKSFPEINWVIGSHSQSFTNEPEEVGKTKLVQVLSRNHYLGEIHFDLTASREKDSFKMHEMRDEVAKKLNPNPFFQFIDKHKVELSKIQQEEQREQMHAASADIKNQIPLPTYRSCLECHDTQGQHWKKTAHSLAYITLYQNKSHKNPECLKCHSIGLGNPRGFYTTENIIRFYKETDPTRTHSDNDLKTFEEDKKKYLDKVHKAFSGIGSVRKLAEKKRVKVINDWLKIDEDMKVTHNFGNVQCLNCHDKTHDHPFDNAPPAKTDMKSKCLSCHDSDQSPEWYDGAKLKEETFQKHYQKIACPLN